MSENSKNTKEQNVKVQKRERPLSPHLQIYKPQITSILSITHRASIIALYFAVFVIVYYSFIKAFSFDCACYLWLTGSEIGNYLKNFILGFYVFIASYWICTTIRHFCWDMGLGFELKTVYKTARIAIFFAIFLTLSIIYLAIS